MLRLIYWLYQFYLFIARPLTFGVRVMLVRDGEVLLVRQTYLDGWFIPGGHDREIAEMRFFPLDSLPAGLWPGHRQRLQEYRRDQRGEQASACPRFGEW